METLVNILNEIQSQCYTKSEINDKLNRQKIFYIVGNHETETNEWTGNLTDIETLTKGTMLVYYLPQNTPSNLDVTLNLKLGGTDNYTGPISVRFANNHNVRDTYKYRDLVLLIYNNAYWLVVDTEKLNVDSTLNSNSSNPLSNSGVYTAINDAKTELNYNIKKNKIFYVIGTESTVASNTWTGSFSSSEIATNTDLANKTIIAYYVNSNPVEDADTTLEITFSDGSTTGELPVRFTDNTNVKGAFQKKEVLFLMKFTDHWRVLDGGLHNLKKEIEDYIKNMDTKYNMNMTTPTLYGNDVDYSVSSKGLIQYTVNVTEGNDPNTELSKGTLVKFEKENGELLGIGVSNNAGNATIFKKHDNDIFRLVASVGNTNTAIRRQMFIQEPNNLMSLNVWSGTELNHSVGGFNRKTGVSITSSTDWSSIGNYSLKIVRNEDSSFQVYAQTSEFTGYAIMKVAFDILTEDTNVVFRLVDYTDANPEQGIQATLYDEILVETNIPASEEKQTIVVSTVIPADRNQLRLIWLSQTKSVPVYIDNIRAIGVGGETMFWDNGINGTADWRRSDDTLGSMERTANGTVITNDTTANLQVWANKYGTTSSSNSLLFDYNAPFVVEFDIVAQSSNSDYKPRLRFYSSDIGVDTTTIENDIDTKITENGHYKFVYNGTRLQTWINDVQKANKDFTATDIRIGFTLKESSLTFKNFRIYTIS